MLRKLDYIATTWGMVRARRPPPSETWVKIAKIRIPDNAGFMPKKPWDDAIELTWPDVVLTSKRNAFFCRWQEETIRHGRSSELALRTGLLLSTFQVSRISTPGKVLLLILEYLYVFVGGILQSCFYSSNSRCCFDCFNLRYPPIFRIFRHTQTS
jgi:hypothetical protein